MKFTHHFLTGLALAAVIGTALLPLPAHAADRNDISTLNDVPPSDVPPAAPQFTTVIEDLPLMPGLSIVPDEDVLFTAPPAGRIAETTAVGEIDIDEMYNFYRKSLPHLGWKIVDARSYLRDNEILRISAHADSKVTTVHFLIKPNAATK